MRASPYAAIATAIACVSTASLFILWSASPPVTIALYRLALASAIVVPIALLSRRRSFANITRADAFLMAGVGAILATHFALWITSLKVQGVTVASSVILVTSHPLLVGLLSHFVLKERLSAKAAVGIVVGFSGVVVIAIAGYAVSGETLMGDLLAFLGGIAAGFYLLAGRRIRQRVSLLGYASFVYASATAVLFLYAIVLGVSLMPIGDLRTEMALFLGLALIPQLGGHTLYNWSLRWVSAPVVSLSLVGEPIGSSLLAWVFLSQEPGLAVAVGGALALAGIYLTVLGESARAQSVETARDVE